MLSTNSEASFVLVHSPSGGLVHFLRMLDGSIRFAIKNNAALKVPTELHKPLGLIEFPSVLAHRWFAIAA